MKKHLRTILIGLITLILIPMSANATSLKWSDKQTNQTKSGGKVVTTKALILTSDAAVNKELKYDITFTVADSASTFEFKANTSAGVTAEKKDDSTYTVTIKSLSSGENTIGAFIITASDEDGVDCGGEYSPTLIKDGTETTGDESEGNDNTETGYGIPYIALAVGTVGTITVIATSKKKNKFYKI